MKARLLNQPKDYERLGINPEKVEVWEDRRRNMNTAPNNWEWWYFDAMLDDGTTAIVQFFTKGGADIKSKGDHPSIMIKVDLPDGTHYQEYLKFKVSETSYGEDQCDVKFANHYFKGDLKEYRIYVEQTNGLGADIKLESVATPYRPGSSYIGFNSDEEYYTWLCAVPRGKVTGTLTVGGKTIQVSGRGYHDHQWGSFNIHKEFNHWVWARQSFDDYTMLVFDMVTNKKTDYTRLPLVFIQDKDGNLVFESTDNVACEVLEEYHDTETSDKIYPKSIKYTFENDGKRVDYSLDMKNLIEARGMKTIPVVMRMAMKTMKLNPSYARYLGESKLKLTDGDEIIERSGELIYEFMFSGDSFKGHM